MNAAASKSQPLPENARAFLEDGVPLHRDPAEREAAHEAAFEQLRVRLAAIDEAAKTEPELRENQARCREIADAAWEAHQK